MLLIIMLHYYKIAIGLEIGFNILYVELRNLLGMKGKQREESKSQR